jgi:hypothetical protein
MDRSKGWIMAVTENSNKLLEQLDLNLENINVTSESAPWPTGDISYGSFDVSPSDQISLGSNTTGLVSNVNWNTNTWTTITDTTTIQGNTPWYTVGNGGTSNSGKLSLQGESADIDINGKSLKNWMEKVEQRLNILTPNPELEKEWDELRRLGERYRKLEKKCQQKSDMWNRLKSMPKPVL